MTRAVYTGHESLSFPDYRDLETGRTLTAEPGGVYEVVPASGRPVPDVPAPWFALPIEDEDSGGEDSEPEAFPDLDDGEPQQF